MLHSSSEIFWVHISSRQILQVSLNLKFVMVESRFREVEGPSSPHHIFHLFMNSKFVDRWGLGSEIVRVKVFTPDLIFILEVQSLSNGWVSVRESESEGKGPYIHTRFIYLFLSSKFVDKLSLGSERVKVRIEAQDIHTRFFIYVRVQICNGWVSVRDGRGPSSSHQILDLFEISMFVDFEVLVLRGWGWG